MYKFKKCTEEEIDKFNLGSSKSHIFQSSLWCNFKTDWNKDYIEGIDENENIVLSCSLIKRKIPYINKYIGYAPRGFICDYTNTILLNEFSLYIKNYCIKENIAFFTIDPDIHLKENEVTIKYGEIIRDNLLKSGFVQQSTNTNNFEEIQPKFVFRLDVSNKDNLSKEEMKNNIFNSFHSKWRYNIRLGKERCLSVEKYNKDTINENILDEFQYLMNITGKRDNFIVRKKSYFKSMIEELYPYATIYMVKYNLKLDKENSIKKINKIKQDIKIIDGKIIDFTNKLNNNSEVMTDKEIKIHGQNTIRLQNLKQQMDNLNKRIIKIDECGKDYVYVSGALYLYYGNKAWYLYGASSNEFRDTMPNFTMQWQMISDTIDKELDIYDFRGVSGDLNINNPLYGLYKFKKGFNGNFVEFIGEFDIVINPLIYKLFRTVFPKYKSIRKKITK